eukprot:8950892-Alexandrium_andersonii.AAC.1
MQHDVPGDRIRGLRIAHITPSSGGSVPPPGTPRTMQLAHPPTLSVVAIGLDNNMMPSPVG